MVNNKIAQRAVAAGLSGLMAFGAAAPAALAYTNYGNFKWISTSGADDTDHWKRLAGSDRYGTMKKIVESYNEMETNLWKSIRKGWQSDTVYNYHSTVVLASGDNWPDALAANGLAGYLTNIGLYQNLGTNDSVPVLITKANSLTTETKDLLKNMQVQNVIIMGGTAAISQDVEDAINKMGIGTQRVAGKDRQETSVKAMQRINGNWKGQDKTYDLIIASGNNYADALSISPYAYRMGTPIILTDKDGKLTDQEVEAIKANDKIKEIVIVGGTDAVKDEVLGQIGTIKNNRTGMNVIRVAGADRYETSAKIAEFELKDWSDIAWLGGFSFDHAIVATGENFPDALVGGQLAGGLGARIDVDGFSAADLNRWAPCPLLLTKDGDQHAESMIARGITTYRVTAGTDTYESFGSWLNTINNWYANDPRWATVPYTTDADKALIGSWYNVATPKFISNKAIDWNVSTTGGAQEIRYSDTSDFKLTLTSETLTLNGTKYYRFTVKGLVDENGKAHAVTPLYFDMTEADVATALQTENDGKHTLTFSDELTWASDVHGVDTTSDDVVELELTHAQFVALVNDTNTVTVDWKDVDWTRYDTIDQAQVYTGWKTEIIGYVEEDEDFYGIILGGRSAVSKDKQDRLEDVVDETARENGIFTVGSNVQGTITLVDDKGVGNSYVYLDPQYKVAANAEFTAGTQTISADATGDVYKIYGTNSYVVAVFDENGDLQTWLYYFNGDNMVGTGMDWKKV